MHFNYFNITRKYIKNIKKVCMYIVFYSQIFTHTAVYPTLSAVCNFVCLILEVSSPFFKKFKKYTVSYILRVIINKNSGIYMLYTGIQFPSYLWQYSFMFFD